MVHGSTHLSTMNIPGDGTVGGKEVTQAVGDWGQAPIKNPTAFPLDRAQSLASEGTGQHFTSLMLLISGITSGLTQKLDFFRTVSPGKKSNFVIKGGSRADSHRSTK